MKRNIALVLMLMCILVLYAQGVSIDEMSYRDAFILIDDIQI